MATKLSPPLPGSAPPGPTLVASQKVATALHAAGDSPEFLVRDGEDVGSNWAKICLYGATATGKTLFIVGLLLADERVLVFSTDFGGSGLQSVKQWFKDNPEHAHLLANLKEIEFPNHAAADKFLKAPWAFAPKLAAFDPTVLFWDGFSGFQQHHVEMYIESTNESRKANLLDFDMDTKNWAQVRNATLWPLNSFFLILAPSGRTLHKVVTCAEDDGKEDKQTGLLSVGPLLHGVSRKMMQHAFDIILRTKKEYEMGGALAKYQYITDGDKYSVTKSRGFGLAPIEPGDGTKLWEKIKGRLS